MRSRRPKPHCSGTTDARGLPRVCNARICKLRWEGIASRSGGGACTSRCHGATPNRCKGAGDEPCIALSLQLRKNALQRASNQSIH